MRAFTPWVATLVVALAACNGPTQLVVEVDTDFAIPTELDAIAVEVTGPSGTTRNALETLVDREELPLTLTVVPVANADSLGPVTVRAIGESGGSAIVSQTGRITLEQGRSLTLRLFLGRGCGGVACPDGETCRCGACASIDAMAGAWSGGPIGGDPCTEPTDAGLEDAEVDGGGGECSVDADCDDSVACSQDTCDAGACANTLDDALCTAGTGGVCILEFGCQYDGCTSETCVAGPCETARCEGDTCILETTCASDQECCGDACVPTGCDDDDPCTDDACGATACDHTPNADICDDGVFCNGGDTCAAGSCSVHAGEPCSGASICDEPMASCVGCVTDADCPADIPGPWGSCVYGGTCTTAGTRERTVTSYACVASVCAPTASMESDPCTRTTDGDGCGTTTFGAWGSCGSFADTCDESGSRTRTRTDRVCGAGVCADRDTPDTGSCVRDTDTTSCGSTTYGAWGGCGGYSDTCDESGTRSRTQNDFSCVAGACTMMTGADSGTCSRTTGGTSCGTTTYGAWGSCGGYSDTCDESGTRSRSQTDFACSAGTCSSSGSTDTGTCSRSTGGVSCGTTTYGAWGSCGSYSSICDESGTRSRSETTFACSGGTCASSAGSDTGACSRTTEGNSCDSFIMCRRGSCSGGACSYIGPGCGPTETCCEPGWCAEGGMFCP